MPTFSGTELEQELEEGRLSASSQRGLVGMVKASETKDHIAFSIGDCESWTDLPTAMIDEAETIGERGCRDHSHPVVRLLLKEPRSAEGKALLSLLQSGQATAPEAPPGPGNPGSAESARLPGLSTKELCYRDCVEVGGGAENCYRWCYGGPDYVVAPIARQAGQLGWDQGNANCYRDCVDSTYNKRGCFDYCYPKTGRLADVRSVT